MKTGTQPCLRFVLGLGIGFLACARQAPEAEAELGVMGASCRSDDDCDRELRCVARICSLLEESGEESSGALTSTPTTTTTGGSDSILDSDPETATGVDTVTDANDGDNAEDTVSTTATEGVDSDEESTTETTESTTTESESSESATAEADNSELTSDDSDATETESTDGSESTDESDTTGTETGDDGCGVLECSPGAQDCPAGLKCTAWRCQAGSCCTDSTRCIAPTGNAGLDEPCDRDGDAQVDDCAPGLFCLPEMGSSGGGGPGHCILHCIPELGGPGNCAELGFPDHHCFNFNQGSFPICLPVCDPQDPDGCRAHTKNGAPEPFEQLR